MIPRERQRFIPRPGPEVQMIHVVAVRQKPEHEILERWVEAKNEAGIIAATSKHFETVFIARRFWGRPLDKELAHA